MASGLPSWLERDRPYVPANDRLGDFEKTYLREPGRCGRYWSSQDELRMLARFLCGEIDRLEGQLRALRELK